MSRKIIGVTVGTPMNPQSVIEKTDHVKDLNIHVTSAEKQIWNAKSNFSGAYGDLMNKPVIPTKTSQLTNDSGFAEQVNLDLLWNEMDSKANQTDVTNLSEQISDLQALLVDGNEVAY